MRILIAPDKFKGSLGAREVGENIAAGLRESLPGAAIDIQPVADGGEGTAEIICEALGGEWVQCPAHDELGRLINAHYVYIEERKLALIEMAEAAGMGRGPENMRDPLRANTFGVGEMILQAARKGAVEIVVGLGGSATNDGGFGMARALGYRFFAEDEHGQQLRRAVAKLAKLDRIEKPGNLSLPKIVGAADVRNPLLGKNGATRVFGPQKGVSPRDIEALERALSRFADEITREFGCDYREEAGAGAAGGLGFGLRSFCDATLCSGFELFSEMIGLEARVKAADVIVTGEGRLDAQTLEGKAAGGMGRLGKKFGKPVFAIVGDLQDHPGMGELFDRVHVLARAPVTAEEAMQQTAELLRLRARELGALLKRSK